MDAQDDNVDLRREEIAVALEISVGDVRHMETVIEGWTDLTRDFGFLLDHLKLKVEIPVWCQ